MNISYVFEALLVETFYCVNEENKQRSKVRSLKLYRNTSNFEAKNLGLEYSGLSYI
jgi:hypothetical protein